jgi:hypothetical protein
MLNREVDIDLALLMIDTVKKWGQRPEIKDKLLLARRKATNSLMGLILTGVKTGDFPNIPEHNQLLLDKLAIAFEMGYYAHATGASGR